MYGGPAGDDGADDRADVVESGPPGPRRRPPRWLPILAAGIVGIAAGAGFMYNHEHATPTPPRTPPTTQPTSAPSVAPASTTPLGTQTPRTTSDVDDRLQGLFGVWELLVHAPGEVARIDFSSGRLTRTALPPVGSSGPVSFVAGPDEAIVRPLDQVPGYVVPDGGRAHELPAVLDHSGPAVPGPEPGQLWIPDTDRRMILVTVDGARTGPSITLPQVGGWPESDGAGNLMFGTTGGVYQARPDGVRRITTGQVLAAGPTGWLAVECDDRLRCSRVLIDRSSRARHDLGRSGNESAPATSILQGAISPDGSQAAVVSSRGDSAGAQLDLVDLTTGDDRTVNASVAKGAYQDLLAWSPDGQLLFAPEAGGALIAVLARTGEVRRLDLPLPAVMQVAIRDTSHP